MAKTHKKTGKQWSANQRKVEALNPCARFKRTTAFESVIKPQQMKDIEAAIKNQVKVAKEQKVEVKEVSVAKQPKTRKKV